MEHYGGRPLRISEIEPLEEEAYVALAVPMLNEIIQVEREQGCDGPVAIEYLRSADTDSTVERIGIVIVDREIVKQKLAQTIYDVTIFHYKEYDTHALDQKDSTVYKITNTDQGVRCISDVMYADGVYVVQHQMNGIEHDMLLDELLAVRQWQLVSQQERDILNK